MNITVQKIKVQIVKQQYGNLDNNYILLPQMAVVYKGLTSE